MKTQSPNHWTAREVPISSFLPSFPYQLCYHLVEMQYFPETLFPTAWNPSLNSDAVSLSSLLTPSCHHVSRPLTELLLSSLSGLSSKTLSSTARIAHRDWGAACSCRSTSAPGSCWEGEKPRETWGREKDNVGIRSAWRGGETVITHMP